jgi:hypothetical protein
VLVDLDGSPGLTETFATVPRWVMRVLVALLALALVAALVMLTNARYRDAGQGALVIAVPLLGASLVVLGSAQTRTRRIDALTERFLRHTVADKLAGYLVEGPGRSASEPVLAPIFGDMVVTFDPSTPSWCRYVFTGPGQVRFQVVVKCNVLNFEVLLQRTMPAGFPATGPTHQISVDSAADLEALLDEPAIASAVSTIRGSLHEGYSIAVTAWPADGGTVVEWKLRQKLAERVILSPLLRRYFAEDAAIAAYFLAAETSSAIRDGVPAAGPGRDGPVRPWA